MPRSSGKNAGTSPLEGMQKLPALLLAVAACTDVAGPTSDPDPDQSTVPDGTVGTMRVRLHGTEQTVRYRARHGHAIYQGDVDLGPISHVRANAIKGFDERWPKGVIHWKFAGVAAADQAAVRAAIADYMLRTPLVFVEGIDDAHPYMSFKVNTNGDFGGYTNTIGPDGIDGGDETEVFLSPGSGESTALHEIGHAIGLTHEQSRADRDNTIDFDPSCSTQDEQYDKYSTDDYEALTAYDVSSIMEYRSSGFCEPALIGSGVGGTGCACFPIVMKNTSHTSMTGFISQTSMLSGADARAVTAMYEPQLGSVEGNDLFAQTFAVGDFDGDGVTDLAVGAPGEAVGATPHTGAVFLYRGTRQGLVAWRSVGELDLAPTSGTGGDQFGFALAAGDFDHDGTDDLAIGAPGARSPTGTAHGGVVWVMYGGVGGPNVAGARELDQTTSTGSVSQAGDRFGEHIAVGDFNNDLRDDLAIAATHEVVAGKQQGYVNTLVAAPSGRSFNNLEGIKLPTPPVTFATFGDAIAVADFDGNGKVDLAITSLGHGVYIYKNTGTGWAYATSVASTASPAGAMYGTALAVGRFDRNTGKTNELVVSAPNEGAVSQTGRMYFYKPVVSGSTLTLSLVDVFGQGNVTGDSNEQNDFAGSALAARDLDGDGITDLVVGVPGKPFGGLGFAGKLVVFPGTTAGFTGGSLNGWLTMPNMIGGDSFELLLPQQNDGLGESLAIGDFNKDGTLDVVGGMPLRNGSAGALLTFATSGSTLAASRYIDETTSDFR